MDIAFRKTNLLILKGVFPKDFSAFDMSYVKEPKRSDSEAARSTSEGSNTVYSRIPKKFIDVASWPKISNLKCWDCDRLPQSYPKFIPLNPERDKDGNDVCDVRGNFCEWNCVVHYVMREYSREQQWDILELVCIIAAKFTGRRREKIMPSPDKTERKEYCGEEGITGKQFQDKIDQLNAEYELTSYKLDDFRNERE